MRKRLIIVVLAIAAAIPAAGLADPKDDDWVPPGHRGHKHGHHHDGDQSQNQQQQQQQQQQQEQNQSQCLISLAILGDATCAPAGG